ncbi:MAG: hypothetical protein FWD66_11340, partial [Paludibacter sp.]|nr:hypothetical protein [Paludibacter sp.]
MFYKNMDIDNLLKPQQQEVLWGSYAIFGCNCLIINELPPPHVNADNQVIIWLPSTRINIQQGIYKNTFPAFCVSYLLCHCDCVSPRQSGKINIMDCFGTLCLAMTYVHFVYRHYEPLQAAKQSEKIQENEIMYYAFLWLKTIYNSAQRQRLGNIKGQIKIKITKILNINNKLIYKEMKKKNLLLKTATATALLLSNSAFMSAQVTIGADAVPAATLDVRTLPSGSTTPNGVLVPRMTKAQINATQSLYTAAQTGAEVYITDFSAPSVTGYSDQIGCVGFVYWDGTQWVSNCGVAPSFVKIVTNPKSFTFYETGIETETPLTVSASGSSVLTYQWFKITGNNINARVSAPCGATDGAGFNTPSFTPRVARSLNTNTTLIASKNGFYRYYVRVANNSNDTVYSEIAEVAVGCGAKNLQGEWISFMCNNLGADNNTMDVQESTSILLVSNASVVLNTFLRSADERKLYGDLYQWGRIADGHENRNAISENGTGGDDVNDNCASWNAITPPTYETWNIPGTSPVVQMPVNQVARADATYYGKFVKTLST